MLRREPTALSLTSQDLAAFAVFSKERQQFFQEKEMHDRQIEQLQNRPQRQRKNSQYDERAGNNHDTLNNSMQYDQLFDQPGMRIGNINGSGSGNGSAFRRTPQHVINCTDRRLNTDNTHIQHGSPTPQHSRNQAQDRACTRNVEMMDPSGYSTPN